MLLRWTTRRVHNPLCSCQILMLTVFSILLREETSESPSMVSSCKICLAGASNRDSCYGGFVCSFIKRCVPTVSDLKMTCIVGRRDVLKTYTNTAISGIFNSKDCKVKHKLLALDLLGTFLCGGEVRKICTYLIKCLSFNDSFKSTNLDLIFKFNTANNTQTTPVILVEVCHNSSCQVSVRKWVIPGSTVTRDSIEHSSRDVTCHVMSFATWYHN